MLTHLYPRAEVLPGRILKDPASSKQREFDYIVISSHPKEILLVELKGYVGNSFIRMGQMIRKTLYLISQLDRMQSPKPIIKRTRHIRTISYHSFLSLVEVSTMTRTNCYKILAKVNLNLVRSRRAMMEKAYCNYWNQTAFHTKRKLLMITISN